MEHLIDLIVAVYAGLAGLLVSSFLNVAVYRLPHGETIVKGHSHCMSCGHPLGALDLVPVFSYLLLGRRCRYCRAPISSRYMTVELSGGIFFALAALANRPFQGTIPYLSLLLACTLFCLLLVDSLIRFDGHVRGLAGLYPLMLGLAVLSTLPALSALSAQSGLLPALGLKAAGLALGLLAVPAASRVLRVNTPLPAVPALPVAGICLGLPAMLAVLLPVLVLLALAALPVRVSSAVQTRFGGTEPAAMARPDAAALWRRLTPVAGFTLFAIAFLLTA